MNRLELTGLIGSHPLGALAAFGLLRVLSATTRNVRLSFVEQDDWVAVLHSEIESRDVLVARLVEWASDRTPHMVLASFGESDVRVPPRDFKRPLVASLHPDTENLPLTAFLVALAADGATDNAKGFVKPSPFYMASGQQSFLDTIRKINAATTTAKIWNEALFGPWTYATAESSCGWDPGTERLHALRSKAPTKEKTTCVAGAVRLAFEALPLFPSFSIGGVVHTIGWTEEKRLDRFRWPVPDVPTTLATLKLLLGASEITAPGRGAHRPGVAAIYESVRHEFGQGYAVFRPATRLT